MVFPNAYSGVKKLYAGEILQLIGAIFIGIVVILGLGAVNADAAGALTEEEAGGMALGILMAFVPALLLLLVGEILVLVGLHQAGKDEPRYMKKGFWAAIIMIIVTTAMGAVSGNGGAQNLAASFLSCLAEILSLFVFLYSIQGVMELAQRLGREDLVSRGKTIMVVLIVGIAASAVASIAATTLGSVASVASVVALIALVLAYVLFLSYLSKAKRMLAGR